MNGKPVRLDSGEEVYVGAGDRVEVARTLDRPADVPGRRRSPCCARRSEVTVGTLYSDQARPITPHGALTLERGRLLADSASTSRAFRPLALAIDSQGHTVVNDGEAWYEVSAGATDRCVIRRGQPGRHTAARHR